jgi:hypothetical protein
MFKKKKKKKPLESTVQYFTHMALLNEHQLLIGFNEKHVLHCDIYGNFLGMVNIGKFQARMLLTLHRLQESIIPIDTTPYVRCKQKIRRLCSPDGGTIGCSSLDSLCPLGVSSYPRLQLSYMSHVFCS